MHIHQLYRVPLTTKVNCHGCDIQLRLATYDEAVYIDLTSGFLPDGPMEYKLGEIVVPVAYSLFQEVSDADAS
jgi:hypothetical protein